MARSSSTVLAHVEEPRVVVVCVPACVQRMRQQRLERLRAQALGLVDPSKRGTILRFPVTRIVTASSLDREGLENMVRLFKLLGECDRPGGGAA